MDIAILITGGTLDKVHDTAAEALAFRRSKRSHIGDILKIGRSFMPRQEVILMKDSLEMTDEDRKLILERIIAANENAIVLTHGTGTMEVTARFLMGKTGNKTVVITGAMRPFSLGKSDAGFNLGGALIAAQTLPAGVYGVMNAKVFPADTLRKDTQRGRFD
jgi:L-asparaginase